MAVAAQLAEKVAEFLHPAVFGVEQLVAAPRLRLVDDGGPRLDPVAAHVAAHVAGCYAHARVVADALDLPGVHQRVDVNLAVAFGEPERRPDASPVSFKGLKIEVFLPGELLDSGSAHRCPPDRNVARL